MTLSANGTARRILDAGCGTGCMSWLTAYVGNGSIFGIDVAQTVLEFCRGAFIGKPRA